MSRGDIKSDFKAKVTAIVPEIPVEKWSGEEAVFNEQHAWPGISITSLSAEAGEPEEIRDDGETYQIDHVFLVYVYTRHTSTIDGDDQADNIMDAIEDGIAGKIIAGVGQARFLSSEQRAAHMGRFLYVMAFGVSLLKS